jgi:hypothetical protein
VAAEYSRLTNEAKILFLSEMQAMRAEFPLEESILTLQMANAKNASIQLFKVQSMRNDELEKASLAEFEEWYTD